MRNDGLTLWNAIAIFEMFKTSWQMGKHLTRDDSENQKKVRIRFLRKTSQGSNQFGKKVLPGIFLRYALVAGTIWKGYILVADIEELAKLDASEIHARRLNAKTY